MIRTLIVAGSLFWSWTAGTLAAPLEVLFSSNKDGNAEIMIVDLNDENAKPKNLTNNKAEDTCPVWRPDGKQIAFASNRDGVYTIFVMDPDGSNVKKLIDPAGKFCYNPAWSPDGKKLAYVMRDDKGATTIVVDADGTNPKPIGENVWDPAWSPDGKRIAFTRFTELGYKIHAMDADGTNVKDLNTGDNRLGWSYPQFSPDGKKLVFSDLTDNGIEVFVCDPDGQNQQILTNQGGTNTYCAWFPDGKRILFRQVGQDRKEWPYFAMDVNGLNRVPIKQLQEEPALNNLLDPGRASFRPTK